MVGHKVPRQSVSDSLSDLLETPEIAAFIAELDALRWTGQKGYGARALVAHNS
jgi:hypothetical protein